MHLKVQFYAPIKYGLLCLVHSNETKIIIYINDSKSEKLCNELYMNHNKDLRKISSEIIYIFFSSSSFECMEFGTKQDIKIESYLLRNK